MIPDTNKWYILALWGRKKTNNSITITDFIYFWLPEAIVFVTLLLIALEFV